MTLTQQIPLISLIKRPLFPYAAAVTLGILAGESLGGEVTLVASLILVFCGFIVSGKTPRLLLPALLVLATFFVSSVNYRLCTRITPDDVSHFAGRGGLVIHGVVAEDPVVSRGTARLRIRADGLEQSGKKHRVSGSLLCNVYNSARNRQELPRYGDRVLLRGSLVEPSEPTNPGQFSYRKYLARQRIYAVMYLRGPYQLKVLDSGHGNPFVAYAGMARRAIAGSIERLMPEPEAGVAAGMALGTYSTLPDEIFNAFSRTGTLHLLAASGFNCAVIFVFVVGASKPLRPRRQYAYIAAIVALLFYMYIVGGAPSISRATKVAVLVSACRILGRAPDPFNILLAAAVAMLTLRPTDLFDVGFQLSFTAVLAIILIMPVLQPIAGRVFRLESTPSTKRSALRRGQLYVRREIVNAALMTVAATIGTLPVTAQHFNNLSVVSLPVNAAVTLLAPPTFLISLAAPLMEFTSFAGRIVAAIDTMIVRLMIMTVRWFAGPAWSCMSIISPGVLGTVGYYLFIGAALAYVSRKYRQISL